MLLRVLVLCAFAVASAEFALVGLLPEIAADLSVSVAAAGQLVTAYMLVVTLGGPLAAVVARQWSRRSVLVAAMALATASAVAAAVLPGYAGLVGARVGSALGQAVFMAVASEVAVATSTPERRTAAVAQVFGGFALATVAGLPLGTLVGQSFGWQATFVALAGLAAVGLVGVVAFCPSVPPPTEPLTRDLRSLGTAGVVARLGVTLLALTGFVAVFTYVAPALQDVTRLSPTWVTVGLVGYGVGTLVGNAVAGRVPPSAARTVVPVALAALATVLALQPLLLTVPGTALAGLVALGVAAFVVVPLVQARLMELVGMSAGGLVAAVNISAAGAAGAAGAALGGAVLTVGPGLMWLGPVAALPVVAAVILSVVVSRDGRSSTSTRIGS